jgi:hypothetical protein
VSVNATVRRQTGASPPAHVEVPIEQFVPGDIVLLSAGDMIPAASVAAVWISSGDLSEQYYTDTGRRWRLTCKCRA